MLNREKDVPYCGVRADVIANAKPKLNEQVLSWQWEFIRDRYTIHVKKDVLKLPPPWVDNPILNRVKFTNVRREHDRQSKWIIENIATRLDVPLIDRMFSIMLCRLWNLHSTYETATGMSAPIHFPMSFHTLEHCCNNIKQAKHEGAWYSAAYNTAPVRNAYKKIMLEDYGSGDLFYPVSPLYVAQKYFTKELFDEIMAAESQDQVLEAIKRIPYMSGEFLAYQFFVDFTYCPDYVFSENEYTVAGPGCQVGLDHLFEDKDGMTYEECLFWVRDNQMEIYGPLGYNPKELFSDLEEYDKCLNIMEIENCQCELGKYVRCKKAIAEGKLPRGKANYIPQVEDKPSTAKSLFEI